MGTLFYLHNFSEKYIVNYSKIKTLLKNKETHTLLKVFVGSVVMELVFQFRLKNDRASGDSLAGGWGSGIRMKGCCQISSLDNRRERGAIHW